MVSNEKSFLHPPGTQHGHPASGWSLVTDTNLNARHDDKKMKPDSHKAKGDINLGQCDCLNDASHDFEFSGSILDDNENPLEMETATKA
jgi:hypothetical protein